MNEHPPHDILQVRPGREPLPPNYRPIPTGAVDRLRAMTEDERAEWLAHNPLTPADRERIERANRRRTIREAIRHRNAHRAAQGEGAGN